MPLTIVRDDPRAVNRVSELPPDEVVVARVLSGDTDAFGILVERYQDIFARYAAHMVGSADEAADVIQDSLVRAFRFLRRCGDPANFKAWLFTIVSNQCKTHLSRRKRRGVTPITAASEVPAPDDTAMLTLAGDLKETVAQALQDLPPDYREALVLKYVEDLSLPEMATLLKCSISALKMRLLRARAALREKLEGAEL
jgi:RNA polymerase sigma-70 factor (ECF subfamily)